MEQSYSDNDVSLSPSRILERLQELRSLQILQRGKLQKQRLQYQAQGSPETSSITEVVSHFSNSTGYNSFRSLLQTPEEQYSPRESSDCISSKINSKDLLDGISVLNLSQESEFIVNSPSSARSRTAPSNNLSNGDIEHSKNAQSQVLKKQISLDDMPILSPKKDFESLVVEKLQNEKNIPYINKSKNSDRTKPFLRRGEGLARFGIKNNNPVIQNTKALPWKRKSVEKQTAPSPIIKKLVKTKKENVQPTIKTTQAATLSTEALDMKLKPKKLTTYIDRNESNKTETPIETSTPNNSDQNSTTKSVVIELPKGKHPLGKGKTWAAILTKEQDDFLRKLKQSDYYKNFNSPSKSITSETSCDLTQLSHEREMAEQNMFELLERKVNNESFNINNSFFTKFLQRNNFECSGESTPLVLQKHLSDNPNLLHIFPDLAKTKHYNQQSHIDDCTTDCSECCSDDCSTISSCCSCKTVEETNTPQKFKEKARDTGQRGSKVNGKEVVSKSTNQSQNDTIENNMKVEMAEMQAKLVATSDLLKERLRELEDEIETFRKENTNLTKMREEVDLERQKFYEEKSSLEQKFNEEKILAEYYLSEEKEKLTKQKQTYERYFREMRGRLNKKDKDEVINLKKEITDLKDEIRLKDAKSTSTIARLRNQLKIIDKEKKDLQAEVEKLKKENRRIQHSNDITRRMTNMKYLEEINKKLTNMNNRSTQSNVEIDNDAKYKSYEIERESRRRKPEPAVKGTIRPRAKSVPNLKVTSRYAKYFSQRDSVSQIDRNKSINVDTYCVDTDDLSNQDDDDDEINNSDCDKQESDTDDNPLEKIYMERFHGSKNSSTSSSIYSQNRDLNENSNNFFLHKSTNLVRDSTSPLNPYNKSEGSTKSKSPTSILSRKSPLPEVNRSNNHFEHRPSDTSQNRLTQNSAQFLNSYEDPRMVITPEPSSSKTSLSKTNLNPTETLKQDGSKELRFPNGNVKYISADGKYSKFVYYNGDIKENFYNEGRIKYYYAETKTYHTTHADGLEVLEFPDGQVEKRYRDGSTEIRLPNGSVRYFDPKNKHVREEWRFPDGAAVTVSANGEQRIVFSNGQIEVRAKDHKRREFPDGTVRLVYNDGTSETRYASGRVRIKDKHGHLIMDSAPG